MGELCLQKQTNQTWYVYIRKFLVIFFKLIFLLIKVLPFGTWGDPANRRKFFEQIAKDNNFDPVSADNWYTHSNKVRTTKVFLKFFSYFGLILLRSKHQAF
jgi:hypothetical protein